jgi:hypothetical protein
LHAALRPGNEQERAMARYTKTDFPTDNVRRFLEPGPIVLVSSAHKSETNIMTMGWHMIMEFQPSLVGCYIWTSCPGRGAAHLAVHRRAGTHGYQADPGSAAHHAADAARCAASGERSPPQ